MSLKVIHGAKVLDGTNYTPDIVYADRTVNTTVNSTAVDMVNHFELIVHLLTAVIDAGATVTVQLQESNESSANFTNISGAIFTKTASHDNHSAWMSVNWKHPDRKRYVRLQGFTAGANSGAYSASTIRMNRSGAAGDGSMAVDTGVIEV